MSDKVHDQARDPKSQDVIRCKVKIYKLSNNMQRCPYIHEMKERLLGEQIPMEPVPKKIPTPPPFNMDQQQLLQQQPVATIVKLNPDGYGSHTSPTHHRADRTPLMPKQPEDEFHYVERTSYPKNAKTSLFIIMSFVYAKILVVICVASVISDVVTHNIPLYEYYYEGFFTYLYGMSILFLLYVFCFLLQESTCCSGGEKEVVVKKPSKQKAKEKEKEKKKEEEKKKKEEKERQKKEKKEKEKEKDKNKDKKDKKQEKSTYRRNSEGVVDSSVPVPVAELENQSQVDTLQEQTPAAPAPPPAAPQPLPSAAGNNSVDVEAGTVVKVKRKRKTTQNDQSHGSFFLRIGAIAFGLGTMIYNGLEFGTFFEVPFTPACYMILRGVNPLLQMIFTFMQMYFIFMNSRLNIHRFKVVARFGLMHVVATNICVWIRTLLDNIKEITNHHWKMLNDTFPTIAPTPVPIQQNPFRATAAKAITEIPHVAATTLQNLVQSTARTAATKLNEVATTLPTTTTTTHVWTTPKPVPTTLFRMFHTNAPQIFTTPSTTTTTTLKTTANRFWEAVTTTIASTTTASTTTSTTSAPMRNFMDFRTFNNFAANDVAAVAEEASFPEELVNSVSENGTELIQDIIPQAFRAFNFSSNTNDSCARVNIMGTIVQDSAPYLFPFIIEYSLIGAAVIYVMWKHIGRNPRYVTQEDLEHRLEIMLSRRAVAMAQAHQGRVDCVGASKGLFFGLLMLVASLICLILFFVLIHHRDFGLLAIYLADVSHCVLMVLSIFAIIIGFIRVQHLKFKTEEQSDLNDILLRVSAFGLFLYAVFSVIAGHLNAFTKEPNLLVMITGVLSVVQVLLQLLFIADVSRRRVHLPEHDRSKPGRQVVTFLLICNVTMWIIYTFETQKVEANPVQLEFYGFLAWAIVQRITLPLCIFHRFHSAVTLAEIWKTSYKARLE
ncbi:uncharacterized protein LOC109597712 isoform X7 [Aethina tumida]|uniref:uncharacterized protein LOC109597712 isoform X7 n=1 Tax=Aethina tumida TaxID=116153 RepID=UPI0021496DBF|nr:uncharacterized protein LOC109597712 isoform X7 [Aethina tumida]